MSVRERIYSVDRFAATLCVTMIFGICGTCAATAAGSEAAAPDAAQSAPGNWVEHDYSFHYMGFTATYSCNGLIDKLKELLRLSGARVSRIEPRCGRGFDVPDRLAQVEVKFSTLQPAAASGGPSAAESAAAGVWRHVTVTPQRLHDSLDEECELVEQFRNVLLPMFAVQNVRSDLHCVPNQDLGPFSLSYDVFAPASSNAH